MKLGNANQLRFTRSTNHCRNLCVEGRRPKVLPKSSMGTAISYALSNREALERYTEDGDL